MKKKMKKKMLARKLTALVLCCLCLLMTIPSAVTTFATNDTQTVGEDATVPEQPAAEAETSAQQDQPAAVSETEQNQPTAAPAEPQVTEAPAAPEEDANVPAAGASDENTDAQPEEKNEETAQPTETPEATQTPEATETPAPEKSAAEVLFDRLMACATYDEMASLLESMSEEEIALLEQFTAEQNAALEAKVAELGGYAVDTLDTTKIDRSYTIEAGKTMTVGTSIDSGSFTSSCDENGITAARKSDGSGYEITVDKNVKAGTYILTVKYSYTNGWWIWTTTTNYEETVKVTVTEPPKTDKNITLNFELVHTIATYAYYKSGNWYWGDTYSSGQNFSVHYNGGGKDEVEYYIFFAKPETNYLLTQFEINGTASDSFDLYSVDRYSASAISGYPNIASVVSTAKSNNYLTMNGYKTSSAPSQGKVTNNHCFKAVKPTLAVSATADKPEVKPDETVKFTVTVKPQVSLSDGQNATVQAITVKTLTINGKIYNNVVLTPNGDGTYNAQVDYQVSTADLAHGQVTLTVDADVTYQYILPVKDRYNVSSQIQTTSTVSSNGSTTVKLADDYGVLYKLEYDKPDDITVPESIPTAPVDSNRYYQGKEVIVKDYNRTDVDDPTNGGTWSFTGWAYGDKQDYTKDNKVPMPAGGLLLVGTWKFTPYPTATITIQKFITGNMANENDSFEFTVSGNSVVDADKSFNLKHSEKKEITVRVGDEITVSETAGNYTPSYTVTVGNDDGAEVADSGSTNSVTYKVTDASNQTITFTNKYEVTIDTGISLDMLPYVIILAVVVLGGAAFVLKRRVREDN